MKVNLKRSAFTICTAVFSSGAFAHAGHDHEHWTSGALCMLCFTRLL